ncbi:MAG: hypothetical protein AABX04_01360 [Nanoarchaeota archaeon]
MARIHIPTLLNGPGHTLVDTGIFSPPNDLMNLLFSGHNQELLGSIIPEIDRYNDYLRWNLEEVVMHDKVCTVIPVRQEISRLRRIFSKRHNYYSSHKGTTNQFRTHRVKCSQRPPEGLNHLNYIVRALGQVINKIRIYSSIEESIILPQVLHVSETDYSIIEAAISYPGQKRVNILTTDSHLETVLLKYTPKYRHHINLYLLNGSYAVNGELEIKRKCLFRA